MGYIRSEFLYVSNFLSSLGSGCGDTLYASFPSWFAISTSKEAWVRDVWREIGGVGHWDPIFFRHLNDWEIDEAERLFSLLDSKKLCVDYGVG